MESLQTPRCIELEGESRSDPRWQLIERILSTEPFQKSSRLPALLRHLAEYSIDGHADELTEYRIGIAVFGKPAEYSPAEDSVVRVNVRQLRLRLHEYFDCEGRDEPLTAGIPKGSYELVFQDSASKPALHEESIPPPISDSMQRKRRTVVWNTLCWIALAASAVCGIGWYRAAKAGQALQAPWPVNAVVRNGEPTKVVVSDGGTMLRLLGQKEFTLEQYLQPGFLGGMAPPRMDESVSRLVKYISDSQLTSFADVQVASTFMGLAGRYRSAIQVYSARDLNRRDLEQGNYVFVGGPTSNPWVSLFADKLNFEVVEEGVGGKMYFLNKKPRPGEQHNYEGLRYTGSGGVDYATISLLPSSSGQGNVLLLQGLREEGTEALAELLADAADRTALMQALKIRNPLRSPVYFEALIRAQTVAGAPVSVSIIATRNIIP